MKHLKLVKGEDPVLRKWCDPVTKFDERLRQTVIEMIRVMKASGGIGLAA